MNLLIYLRAKSSFRRFSQIRETKPGSGVGDPPEISIGDAVYVYLPVKDLVDVYTGGNGITFSSSSVVAAKIDAANGLSATADGLKLDLVTTTTAGTVSAADKAKLDGIGFATDAEVDAMLDEIFTTNA